MLGSYLEPRGKKHLGYINKQLQLLYLGMTQKFYSCSRSFIHVVCLQSPQNDPFWDLF